MGKITWTITKVNYFIGKFVPLFVFLIFTLLLADVVLRYLLDQPAIWTAELSTLIFGVYAMIGGGYLLAERGHVNVDIFYGNFSERKKALVDVMTWPLFLVFVLVLLWQGYDMAVDSVMNMERSNSPWHAPLWPVKIMIPVTAMLILLQGIVRLLEDIQTLFGRTPSDGSGAHRSDRDADYIPETATDS